MATAPAVRVKARQSLVRRGEVWSLTGGSRRRETGLWELSRPGPFSDEVSGESEREREEEDERGMDEICAEG